MVWVRWERRLDNGPPFLVNATTDGHGSGTVIIPGPAGGGGRPHDSPMTLPVVQHRFGLCNGASSRSLRQPWPAGTSEGCGVPKVILDCPVSDFFGSGVGMNGVQSWYRTVLTNGTMVCCWVMPCRKRARLTVANLAEQSIRVSFRAIVSPWSWDDRSMHFHSVWHYEAGLKTPPLRDWNFVKLTGQGVYVGDTLALFNPIATWYGEGDEKIWVDGESFPSHLGTGTEDYYGFSSRTLICATPVCTRSG